MSSLYVKKFLRERKKAFELFTEEAIRAYARKWDIKVPEDANAFWLGAHRARAHMSNVAPQYVTESREWLKTRGYSIKF